MYLVNISFFVACSVEGQWLEAVRESLMPQLRKAGFDKTTFSRMVGDREEGQAVYSLLVEVGDMDGYEKLTGDPFKHYLNRCAEFPPDSTLWFATLLESRDLSV